MTTPAVNKRALGGLFPWNSGHQERAVARLIEAGEITDCLVDGKPGLRWYNFTQ